MKTLNMRYFLLLTLWYLVSAAPEIVKFRLSDKRTSYKFIGLSGRPQIFVINVVVGADHKGKAEVGIELPRVYQTQIRTSLSVHVDLQFPRSANVDKFSLVPRLIKPSEHREAEEDRKALWPAYRRFDVYRLPEIDIQEPGGFTMTFEFSGKGAELMCFENAQFIIQVNSPPLLHEENDD